MKEKYFLKKIVSCLCLLIAIASFFFGWVEIRDSKYTREIKSYLRGLEDNLDELKDVCDWTQEMFENDDIVVAADDVYDTLESIYYIIEDLAFSPKELAEVLPMSIGFCNAMEEIRGYLSYVPYLYYLEEIEEEIEETLQDFTVILVCIAICFVVTIGIDIMYIIFHLKNKDGVGVPVIIFHAIWTIVITGIVMVVNYEMVEDIGVEILTITPAAYIGLAMAILSAFIWSSARKDYVKLSASVSASTPSPVAVPISTPIVVPTLVENLVCPQCGAKGYDGDAFCNYCGTKLVREEPVMQEETVAQEEPMKYCGNCGKQILQSALFCKYCGTKAKEN